MDRAHPGRRSGPGDAPGETPEAPAAPKNEPAPPGAASCWGSGQEPCRLLADHTPDLACLTDPQGRLTYASPSCQALLGHTPSELVGRHCLDLAAPEDHAALQRLLDEARFLHEMRKGEVRCLHRQGSVLVLEFVVGFVFREDGAPYGALLAGRDVTERKRLEEESRLLGAFPRHNPNPVLAFAADGTLLYFNEAAQAMARALRKEHPKDILPLNIAAVVRTCLASGDPSLRLENVMAGRTLSWSFFPDRAGQTVHCYAEEITERIELETKLRQSQKMQSVGQLAAGVAHDFNNILTIIKGHTILLLESTPQGPALHRSIQEVATATERAVNLTRQLLMFSRKQLAQAQIMDLNDAIKESSTMLRVLVGDTVRLRVSCAANLPAIYADPSMIQQVLINLAANARDAMPKGGDLTVQSAVVDLSPQHAERVPEARPGQFVCLSVTDTGSGIDAQTLERVFEPFFTTKEPGKGTGLGLATVYGIAKQHHGWVEAASQVGQGATFKVFIPAASKAFEYGPDFFKDRVTGGSETILVVEDEAPLRELVVEILQQYGYQTLAASNGAHALEVWEKNRQAIDLVFTDVMMPEGVSGRDLAERVLSDDPSTKVLYTSGYPVDVLGRDFFQKEGVAFLQKPYHPQTLARVVRECLDA